MQLLWAENNNMNNISYFGIAGSFSFIAAQKFFGDNIQMLGSKTFKDVFMNVKNLKSDFGVVPVENSTTGSILETYDQLMDSGMSICGEIRLKIHHNLLVTDPVARITDIKKCYSHLQAISQCDAFFGKHRWIKPVLSSDTATAAEFIAGNKNISEAAIASVDTAKIYNLKILKNNIEDNKNNFTRFVIIGSAKNKSGNKASIVFSVKHVPGSLFQALRPYANLELNLTKIESRPLFGKTWEYIFFADFDIENKNENFHEMIRGMKETTEFINILGIYDKGETYET